MAQPEQPGHRGYASHNWTPVQRKWLQQLAKQLAFETIVDRRFVNARFADKGGARQLDKVLDEIDEIADHLWQQPA
ncbi:type I restriction-modification enzyme R subunit C-terminal domain-containing protein [Thiorhodococcus drewsii]|uniref:type I restriction-modification enzyme R subunit C-terminal domain-containing protein n=1 Tax=Thiorhodococcus drewsii TaxID=210408 RepID=UPI0024788094|nr:type I restriction-modification enzyme R subunit C-terminal domain-containing protein [Thiorhodococcus drewsii]